MPDESRTFTLRAVSGVWRQVPVSGVAALVLDVEGWSLRPRDADHVSDRYAALAGATWRGEHLTIYGNAGRLSLESAESANALWVSLTQRAAALPEFTRGLRSLGSRRGGDAAVQSKFFAPLLQARRRLEDEAELERRLDVFDAVALAERVNQVIESLARERFPDRAPNRRALEAELSDAVAPLLASLAGLRAAGNAFKASTDETTFTAWRVWVATVTDVFSAADRSWTHVARALPSAVESQRRAGWLRGRRRGA